MGKNITKYQFHEINRSIKQHEAISMYDAENIAADLNVSPSTVRTIKRAKTWPGFLALKNARHTSE